MSSKINAIVFDVGNVIVQYVPQDVLDGTLPDSSYQHLLKEHFLLTPIWDELDRGSITLDDAFQTVSPLIPDHPNLYSEMSTLVDQFVYHLPLITDTKRIMKSLRNRYPIYLLSNFQSVPFSKLRELFPFLYEVNGCVVSAHIKMMKPDLEIYQYFLDKFSLSAKNCLFIDDRPENIAGCKAAGMDGIVFNSPDQLIEELKNRGIDVVL